MDEVKHFETITITNTKIISNCSCGARWSHSKNRSEEEIEAIFKAHVKYFNDRTLVL
jgi:hypothetical protein